MTSTSQGTLTEFLLARIEEDEAEVPAEHRADEYGTGWNSDSVGVEVSAPRWLAECEAKRRIVVRCSEMQLASSPMAVHLANQTLADLAAPYRDHPDYRDEWRP